MAKPRKWSNLEGQLPAPPSQDPPEWVQKILDAKDFRHDYTLADIEAEFAALDKEEERAKAEASDRNIRYAALESLALDRIKADGIDLWRGKLFSISPRFALHANVIDKAALVEWVKTTDRAELLSVMPGTVTSLAGQALDLEAAAAMTPAQRAEIKPGEPGSGATPPGIAVFLRPTINRRKA